MARFILDGKTAVRQYKSLAGLGEVWYNLKTNPEVGSVIEEKTKAMIVASGKGNLDRLSDRGRAVVLVQGEDRGALEAMAESGVSTFVVDNENDLKNIPEDSNTFIRLRMKEHSIYTGKYFVYGIDWRRLGELVGDRDQFGIHFHRKTQNVGEWSLVDDLKPVVEEFGERIHSVNIGGGLPIRYHNSKPAIKPILRKIEKLGEFLKDRNISLILEPGRYIAGPAVKLETRIINTYEGNLVVDASIFNSAMDTYLLNIRLPVEGESRDGHQYLIKGRSPDSLDIFRYKVFFKNERKEGDTLVFLNAGAYNFHTDFSDLPRIPTVPAGSP